MSGQLNCVVCATQLKQGARRCTVCQTWQYGINCVSCDLPIPVRNPRAKKKMRRPVRRCPHCKAYQDWRSIIPGSEVVLALVLSIFSVFGAFLPTVIELLNDRSKTSVRLVGRERREPSGSYLIARATNTGKRPAYIRGGEVSLGGSDLAEPKLIMLPLDLLLEPDTSMPVKFEVLHFAKKDGVSKTRQQVLDELKTKWITLRLIVDETTRTGDAKKAKPKVEFLGADIYDWANENVSADPQTRPAGQTAPAAHR